MTGEKGEGRTARDGGRACRAMRRCLLAVLLLCVTLVRYVPSWAYK